MKHVLAAIRTGTEPAAPLPPASFHRTLEEPVYCPKCEAAYLLICDYDWATSRHFEAESRRHLAMLRKQIFLDHAIDHRTSHYETNGVVVTRHEAPQREPRPDARTLKPLTERVQ